MTYAHLVADLTRQLLANMRIGKTDGESIGLTLETLLDETDEVTPGRLFAKCVVYLDNSSAAGNGPARSQCLRFSSTDCA